MTNERNMWTTKENMRQYDRREVIVSEEIAKILLCDHASTEQLLDNWFEGKR